MAFLYEIMGRILAQKTETDTMPEVVMKRLVEFDLEDGSSVYMEIDEPAAYSGLKRAGGKGVEKSDAPENLGPFKKTLEQVRPAAEMVLGAFREMNAPAEIGLEFALKLNTQVGSFLFASADSEASFKVSLKWKNEPR
jgi:hypothetical protein